MGTLVKIKRTDQLALGTAAEVLEALASVFSGVVFSRKTTGAKQLARAAGKDIVLPEEIREGSATLPAKWEGKYEGADCSIQFYMPPSEPIRFVLASVRGAKWANPLDNRGAEAASALFDALYDRTGWKIKRL